MDSAGDGGSWPSVQAGASHAGCVAAGSVGACKGAWRFSIRLTRQRPEKKNHKSRNSDQMCIRDRQKDDFGVQGIDQAALPRDAEFFRKIGMDMGNGVHGNIGWHGNLLV